MIEATIQEVRLIDVQYREGLITDGERYNKVIDIWARVTEDVSNEMLQELGSEEYIDAKGRNKKASVIIPFI